MTDTDAGPIPDAPTGPGTGAGPGADARTAPEAAQETGAAQDTGAENGAAGAEECTGAGAEAGASAGTETATDTGAGDSPAPSGGWRAGLRAHWQTCRPYTLSYPGLVGLAGAALAGSPGTAVTWATAWAAPTLGWISGHYLGDWFDRELDAIGKPQRPIPSGRLRPRTAVVCGVACAFAAATAAAFANWHAVLLVALAMAGIVAYSRLLKGSGFSGNAVRGALTATTLVFGAMTAGQAPPLRVLPFALVFWAHDAASNLVGTLRDVEADRDGGYLTFPVRHGTRAGARTAAALYAAALATALGCAPLVPADGPGTPVLLLAAAAGGAYAFVPLLRANCSPPQALRAHAVLVGERLVLAAALLAGGLGLWPALAVLVPLLALSLLAQARMRTRHEFPSEEGPGGPGPREAALPVPPPPDEDEVRPC